MAGDWIKFQIDTPDKPEVVAIASRLGIDPDAVVGKLIRVWSWFDKHTVDGNAESVTLAFLDRITGVTGFGEQMIYVGWLHQNGSILTMVNFGYHNGKSAKSRALGRDRVANHRNGSSVTNALPEKRREENITTINSSGAKAPKAKRLDVDSLPTEWLEFCKTNRTDLEPTAVFEQFKDYWIAQGGQKGAKLDWFATWRNWVRNQKSIAGSATSKELPLATDQQIARAYEVECGGDPTKARFNSYFEMKKFVLDFRDKQKRSMA
jgi:hypothetical protein